MQCDRFREAASARLDGEPLGLPETALDAHLAHCRDCAGWVERATQATRRLRLRDEPVPDLVELIVRDAALPAARVRRRRLVLRAALLAVGVVQSAIAVPALDGDSLGMAMAVHAAHESAAWNLALGVAFLAGAVAPRRAAGLVPLLATFVVVLGALSIGDVLAGAVPLARLLTHLGVLVGLVLLVALDRSERALPPRGTRANAPGDSARPDRLRGVA